MTLRVANVGVDCVDVWKVANFWAAALGRPVDEGSSEVFASIGAGVPVLETEINDRDAFKAVFSFQQTLDGLNAADVPNLDRAKLNAWEFVHEVVERLKAAAESSRESEDNEAQAAAGAA